MTTKFQKTVSRFAWLIALVMTASVLVVTASREATAQYTDYFFLLWDGDAASVPTGWQLMSGAAALFSGNFPRGYSSYSGTSAGSNTHTHVVSLVSCGQPVGTTSDTNTGSDIASSTHTHTSINPSLTGTANPDNLPPYRELKVIVYYNSGSYGIPTYIPQDVIAIFTDTVPASGWTRFSTQDGYFIRGGYSAGATGGQATHTHGGVNITTGGPSSSTGIAGAGPKITGGNSSHTHSQKVSGTTAPADHTPLNVDVLLYSADSDTSIPEGMVAMFSATPPSGNWTVLSNSPDGVFYEKYLDAEAAYSASGGATPGAATHTHTNLGIVTGGPSTTSYSDTGSGATVVRGTAPAPADVHSHVCTVSFGPADNLPTYVNVIIGQYKTYTPATRNWRWFDAEDVADPDPTNGGETTTGDAMANEDTTPANTRIAYAKNAVKLRIVIGETNGADGTNVKFKLQYDTSDSFPTPLDVATSGDTSKSWRYYNGDNVTDDDVIQNVRLSGSPSAGRHNEDSLIGLGEGSMFSPTGSIDYEHEFTIQNYGGTANTTYYFRAQYIENSTGSTPPGGAWATVTLGGGEAYPSAKTAAVYDLEVSQTPADVQLGTYSKGNGGSLSYDFVGGEEIVFWDKRGTGAAYDATVSGMSMSSAGDTIPGTDITWTSTAANPPDETKALKDSFASDRTDMTGNTGQTLDTDRNAYQAGSTTPPDQARRGGFYFLPSMSFGNLDSRDTGDYSGTLVLTVI